MRYPHIATGKHMSGPDPRFHINTAPGVMEPKHGVNEVHGSYLQRHIVVELRDELNEWLKANPTAEEMQAAHDAQVAAKALRDAADAYTDYEDDRGGAAMVARRWLRARADTLTVADAPAADDEGGQER